MQDIIKRWNPFWVDGKVPENKVGIKRSELLDRVTSLIKPKEIIVLSGVRRSGKSTLIYQAIAYLIDTGINPKNILYFNFDEPFQKKSAYLLEEVYTAYLELNNPKGRKFVFFDEIQNIPEWEKWTKKYYDMHSGEIKFILTGSNSTMLSDSLAKLLTGRLFRITVFPLSFAEFLYFNNLKVKDTSLQKEELKHFLLNYFSVGGFPEAVLERDEEIRRLRLKEYYDSILFRDIISVNQIREAAKLNELAYYSIANIGTLLSYNKISRALGLNINSVKEYLYYLENAYFIFQLNFFSYSVRESVMVQMPRKIYAIDTGLRGAASFTFSQDHGRIAENLVFLELKRQDKEIYYWKGKLEVDFVVRDKSLTAINICYADKMPEREINALLEFKSRFKKAKLVIITKDTEKKEKGIDYIPLWKWLLGISY